MAGRVLDVTADGLRLTDGPEVVLDCLLDGRRVWSFHLLRDSTPLGHDRFVPWAPALEKYLDGATRLRIAEHVSGDVWYDADHRFGTSRDRISVTDDDLTQIQYAALLHDFGKVGVREHILVKAKKLYEHERELILQRFQLIKRGFKIEALESKVRYLMEASRGAELHTLHWGLLWPGLVAAAALLAALGTWALTGLHSLSSR